MKVLVTGATGFLGGTLVRRLAGKGHCEVVATGRRIERGRALEEELPNVVFRPADLEDRDAVAELCAGTERVFHCGALSAPWGRRAAFAAANILGTKHVIEGCRRHGVSRLVYVSSPSVYEPGPSTEPIKEDASRLGRPLNHYIATKRRAEALVEASRWRAITIRPRALFGPGDETLFPRVLRANRNGRFPLIGGHDPWMDCTYIDNVVDALLLASDAPPSCDGKVYNITNGDPLRRSELFSLLFTEVGMPFRPRIVPASLAQGVARLLELGSYCLTGGSVEPVLTRYTVEVLSSGQVLDITAARRELGYEPRVSVREGLKRFGRWWRQQQTA